MRRFDRPFSVLATQVDRTESGFQANREAALAALAELAAHQAKANSGGGAKYKRSASLQREVAAPRADRGTARSR